SRVVAGWSAQVTRQTITRMVSVCAVRIVLVIAGLGVLLLAGCGPTRGRVVAAFYPLAFAAQQIGGPGVRGPNLTPPRAEPHDIDLPPREGGGIQLAEGVLYLSHGFQPAVEQAVKGAHGKTIDVLQGLRLRPGDPHVWLDPPKYAHIVRSVGAALGRPRAAEKLVRRVDVLDAQYRNGLAH